MVKGEPSIDWNSYNNADKILASFRGSREFMDMVLVSSEGKEYPVHSLIISSLSKEFWESLESTFKYNALSTKIWTTHGDELNAKLVHVPLESHVLEAFIDSAYSGNICSDALRVWDILDSAEKFNIHEIKKACCSYISKLVDATNCTEMYRMAVKHKHRRLFNVSLDTIQNNFIHVLNQGVFFATLDLDSLGRILTSDHLNIPSEEVIWTAIKKWVHFDHETRKWKLPDLVKTVRILRAPSDFMEIILTDPILDEPEVLNKVWRVISDARHLFEARREAFAIDGNDVPVDPHLEIAKPRVPSEVIIAVGGWKQSRTSKYTECYDVNTNQWFFHPNMRGCPIRAYHGMEYFDNKIWILGGTDGGNYMTTVDSWNPENGEWTSEAEMTVKRCYVSTAVCNGQLYAIGGHNGAFRMRSIEVYDREEKIWKSGKDMLINRSDASACTMDNKIYVVGGLNENQIENTAEVFDSEKNEWTLLPEMTHRRTSLAVVSLKGFLYAIGGNNGETRLASVEKYDPCANEWTQIANMIHGRSTFSATVMKEKIYVVGGYDGSSTIDSVEFFDPATSVWTEVSPLRFPRSGLSLVTLGNLPFLKKFSFLGLFKPGSSMRSRSPRRRSIRDVLNNMMNPIALPLPEPEE